MGGIEIYIISKSCCHHTAIQQPHRPWCAKMKPILGDTELWLCLQSTHALEAWLVYLSTQAIWLAIVYRYPAKHLWYQGAEILKNHTRTYQDIFLLDDGKE